jgi:hypothetical protein
MKISTFIVIAVAMAAMLQEVSASSLSASGFACVAPTTSVPFACSQSANAPTISTVLAAGTGSSTVSTSNQSGYGVLHSQAAASFTGSSTPVLTYVNGAASFTDQITINFAPFTGSTGYLDVGFTLDGIIARSGSLNAESYVTVVVDRYDEVTFTSSFAGTYFFPQSFSFVYGTPFDLFFNLGTVAGTFDTAAGGGILPLTTTASGSGDADFSNTLVLTALQVVDSQGHPVNGVTFTSDSGTSYSANGVVPEPSTLLLLGFGIAAITAQRFRVGRSSSISSSN